MPNPQIIVPDIAGYHNASDYVARLSKEKMYRDLSTIIIVPAIGPIPTRVVGSWQGLMRPMNQKVIGPIFLENMEVGEAYNAGIKMILENPELAKFKFILTLETDNCPPPDGLLKLCESIDDYDVVGGLYWTKGEGGAPMCYGNPEQHPLNFIPFPPSPNTIVRANGLGMGFNLWRMEMFRDKRFDYGNWFKTVQSYDPQVGAKAYTQDLSFFEKAGGLGYKFACDARVLVGHYDTAQDRMW
jgi:hypothetical protein